MTPDKNIYDILEIKMITYMCILDMRILNEEFGIPYKPSLTKLINHVDIEHKELNYKDKNYATHFFNECKKKYPNKLLCETPNMFDCEINMILKSYPKDHYIQTWKFQCDKL
jgi:hypothetical protein